MSPAFPDPRTDRRWSRSKSGSRRCAPRRPPARPRQWWRCRHRRRLPTPRGPWTPRRLSAGPKRAAPRVLMESPAGESPADKASTILSARAVQAQVTGPVPKLRRRLLPAAAHCNHRRRSAALRSRLRLPAARMRRSLDQESRHRRSLHPRSRRRSSQHRSSRHRGSRHATSRHLTSRPPVRRRSSRVPPRNQRRRAHPPPDSEPLRRRGVNDVTVDDGITPTGVLVAA